MDLNIPLNSFSPSKKMFSPSAPYSCFSNTKHFFAVQENKLTLSTIHYTVFRHVIHTSWKAFDAVMHSTFKNDKLDVSQVQCFLCGPWWRSGRPTAERLNCCNNNQMSKLSGSHPNFGQTASLHCALILVPLLSGIVTVTFNI